MLSSKVILVLVSASVVGCGLGQSFNPLELVSEEWFSNRIDHFGPGGEGTYEERYFVYDKYWGGNGSPIFFYCGNEADVTKYVNATGLMWENAKSMQAMLVFAEHRYYGKSLIPGKPENQYLDHEQALADFASILYSLQENRSAYDSKIIAFGGSYGGMLSAWFRFQYPSLVTGAIAASAPIFAFLGEGFEFYENGGNDYWKAVTHTAGPRCADRIRSAFVTLMAYKSMKDLASTYGLCEKPVNVLDVALWVANVFDTLAMGSFPFRSNYLTDNPAYYLPAYPMKAACSAALAESEDIGALFAAASVFYNVSQQEKCFKIPKTTGSKSNDRFSGKLWTYQWCKSMLPEEFYFTMNGKDDMFFKYNDPFSVEQVSKACSKAIKGLKTDPLKIRKRYGSPPQFLGSVSRIVFSNGLLDPWHTGSVTSISPEQQTRDLHVLNIPSGAHHVDLMFTNPGDAPDVTAARKQQVQIISSWLDSSDELSAIA